MVKKLLTAGLVAGALALNAPVASASHEQVTCRFNSVSQATVTGQDTWEGVAEGIVVGGAEAVAIRCIVRVGTSIRAATDWGTGTGVATTAGRVTYTRTLSEVTQLCAQYTTASEGAKEVCFGTTTLQVPPQEVIDALEPVDDAFCDAAIGPGKAISAPTFDVRPGSPDRGGNPSYDLYVNGGIFYDCPGYEA